MKFRGEVSASEFLNGKELAIECNIEFVGMDINVDSGWLQLLDHNKELLIAKKPLKSHISWSTLNDFGLVTGSERVTVNNREYKVRLLSGISKYPVDDNIEGYYQEVSRQSEWNRFMYAVHSGKHIDPITQVVCDNVDVHFTGPYNDEDLGIHYLHDDGSKNWCQELLLDDNSQAIQRGYLGAIYLVVGNRLNMCVDQGWRPVLELINKGENP